MMLFEWLSIAIYGALLGTILWGINERRKSNDGRTTQMTLLGQALDRMGAGIECLLEHSV